MQILVCKWHEELIETLTAMGLKVGVVVDRYDRATENIRTDIVDSIFYIESFDSVDELMALGARLHHHFGSVDFVLGHTEYGQYGVAVLSLHLNPKNTSWLKILVTRNKLAMKHALIGSHIPHAKFQIIDLEKNKINPILSYPLVIKPVNGQGSRMTFKLNSHEDLKKLQQEIQTKNDDIIKSREFLCEEFIDGKEFHIDTVWQNGNSLFFCVSEYFAPCLGVASSNVRNGSFVIRQEDNPNLYERLFLLHQDVNKILQISDGATHMEVFLTKENKLYFSEVASRVGGGGITESIRATFGKSMHQLLANVTLVEPHEVFLATNKPQKIGAWLDLRPIEPGTISWLPNVKELQTVPWITWVSPRKKLGDSYKGTASSEFTVLVAFEANSGEELEERISILESQYRCQVHPS
ncbi:MAG: ATP-grasp domain-containing protein [Oligoflexales bacterium]|nr:ATP-grasp domain-containing protein [Oligoflexales bacterium]